MSAVPRDPQLCRVIVGDTLQRLRNAHGFTQKQVAEATGITLTRIMNHENARATLTEKEADLLLGLYKAPAEVADRARERLVVARGRAKPSDKEDQLYTAHEENAESIAYVYGSVPGPLQTEAYAAHQYRRSPMVAPYQSGAFARSRIERGAFLRARTNCAITAVMGEEAIRKHRGTPADMVEQIDRLMEFAALDHIHVLIVPDSTGEVPGHVTPYALMRIADDYQAAFADVLTGIFRVGDPSAYAAATQTALELALSDEDSLAVLERYRGAFRKL
ncbi:helix-turn-helix domain-containing protein [Actinokineospora pegani]|uniref:helix-turn-helix domain-containing protein n=1 Tax=Actinokineospora pegani TaxID=2654637 RepID=UPI0018D3F114|nr:helix-turn-helix transcriptional regulator [Actinokineospora pegani]